MASMFDGDESAPWWQRALREERVRDHAIELLAALELLADEIERRGEAMDWIDELSVARGAIAQARGGGQR